MSELIAAGTVTGVIRCLLCDRDAVLRIENANGKTADFCEDHADMKPLLDAYRDQTNGSSVVVIRVEPNATVGPVSDGGEDRP